MPVPRVIDLSHHNVIPCDLMEAARGGVIGCIHKLTEGSSYVDDKVQARYFFTKEAGMLWGIYHFLRPGDMDQQARFFVDTAMALGVFDDDTCVVADHEDQSVSGEELKAFLDAVEDLTGHSPVVYSGHVLKEQLEGSDYRMKRRLWLCQYCSPPPTLPEGVDSYWLWQYTDAGEMAGINAPVDLNSFEGPDEDFIASWSGNQNIEPPAPDVPQVELHLTATQYVEVHVTGGENVKVITEE